MAFFNFYFYLFHRVSANHGSRACANKNKAESIPAQHEGPFSGSRYPLEINKATVDIGLYQLHAHTMTNVETFEATHNFSLPPADGRSAPMCPCQKRL